MLYKVDNKQASSAKSRLIPGNPGAIFNKSSHTQDLKVSFNFGKDQQSDFHQKGTLNNRYFYSLKNFFLQYNKKFKVFFNIFGHNKNI